jgi:hypothetical protein
MGIVRYYTSKLTVKHKIVSTAYEIKSVVSGGQRRKVFGDWLIKPKESPGVVVGLWKYR